ncbi:MAG: ankyrin repeat domain-containing protein [Calditrichia bacterium]
MTKLTSIVKRQNTRNFLTIVMLSVISLGILPVIAASPFLQTSLSGEIVKDAVAEGNHHLIKGMVEAGFDVNTKFTGDGTLLIFAIRSGSYELVNFLIENGADVNLKCEGDGNPLIAAAAYNQLGIAKKLLKSGANIDSWVKGDETALINAAREGHLDMVKFLIDEGANANLGGQTDNGFRSPLNQAKTAEIRNFLKLHGATN